MMSSFDSDLPLELEEKLRSLEPMTAPDELDARISLALTKTQPAPEELWRRVSANLAKRSRGRMAILYLPRLAAAIFVCGFIGLGFNFFLTADKSSSGFDVANREHYKSRVVVLRVDSRDLSSAARSLASMVGVPVTEEQVF